MHKKIYVIIFIDAEVDWSTNWAFPHASSPPPLRHPPPNPL